jgi:hypothetical protein
MPMDGMPDLERVPLAGFRLGVPRLTLERSHGRPIAHPSAFEVESQVRQLGDGLDYVILDMGGEHYLQAAAQGYCEIPTGVFWVERREGGPDRHFRCEVDTVEEVAEIFRGYLVNQDARRDREWERIRL